MLSGSLDTTACLPQLADGGGGGLIVTANILNKHSQKANKGSSSSLGSCQGQQLERFLLNILSTGDLKFGMKEVSV